MNKLKTYLAVILYLTTYSVYAVRGVESSISHVLGPASTFVCGLFEPDKSELDKFLEVSNQLDCSSKEDIKEHCSCIKKVDDKPLSTPLKNKYLAEFGFLTHGSDEGRTKSIRDLAILNSVLGNYTGHGGLVGPLDPRAFGCLQDDDIDNIETKMKQEFKKSADTKMGVPALYRPDYIRSLRASNQVKFMDDSSRKADQNLIVELVNFISKEEGQDDKPELTTFSPVKSPLSKYEFKTTEDPQISTVYSYSRDMKRAELVNKFLSKEVNQVVYSNSPLFKIFAQTHDRSKADISDYLGRVASNSGLIDLAKNKQSGIVPIDVAISGAMSKVPISSFLTAECNRIKEEIKKAASSNYLAPEGSMMIVEEQYLESMSFDRIYKSQKLASDTIERLTDLVDDPIVGKENYESLGYYRKRFQDQYRDNLKVFDQEKADHLLEVKDFNFSQLICSNIEVENKVDEIITEIEKSGKGEKIVEQVEKAQKEIASIDGQVQMNRLEAEKLAIERSSLVADNGALIEKRNEAAKIVAGSSKEQGQQRDLQIKSAKLTIESITSNIDRNVSRIEEIDNRSTELRADLDQLLGKKVVARDAIVLPVARPMVAKPGAKLPERLVLDIETQRSIKQKLLDKETASYVIDSLNGAGDPTEVLKFTGENIVKTEKIISRDLQTGESVLKTKKEALEDVIESENDTTAIQLQAVRDNRVIVPKEVADALEVASNESAANTLARVQEFKQLDLSDIEEARLKRRASQAAELAIGGYAEARRLRSQDHDPESPELSHLESNLDQTIASNSNIIALKAEGLLAESVEKAGQEVPSYDSYRSTKPVAVSKPASEEGRAFSDKVTTGVLGLLDGGTGDFDKNIDDVSQKIVTAALGKLKERGHDVDEFVSDSNSDSPSGYYEKTIETKNLQAQRSAMQREIQNKRGKLKGLEVGNIGLSKQLASQRRSVSKIKDYSLEKPEQYLNQERFAKIEPKEKEAELDVSKKETKLAQKNPKSVVKEKDETIDNSTLKAVEPQSKKLVSDIKKELKKAKRIKSSGSRSIASGSIPAAVSSSGGGSSAGASVSASSVSSKENRSNSDLKQDSGRAPSSAEKASVKMTPSFNSDSISLDAKSYEVSPVLDGVDSDLYVRLPNFDTPKDFMDYSIEKRNKWIKEQFKSSKSLEAIIVFPGGKKLLVKKKD